MKLKPKAYSMGISSYEIIYRCGNPKCDFTFNMANKHWHYCPCCGTQIDWGVITRANEEWKQKFLEAGHNTDKQVELLSELNALNKTITEEHRRAMLTTEATQIAIRKSNAQYYLGVGWTKENLIAQLDFKEADFEN